MNKNCHPVFVIGNHRSGTSLLRALLDSHPKISIGTELKFIRRIKRKMPCFDRFLEICSEEAGDYEFEKDELQAIYSDSNSWSEILENWCKHYAKKRDKSVWGDKTPDSWRYYFGLLKHFREANYIHIVRNPNDVMGSLKSKGWYSGYRNIFVWLYTNTIVLILPPKRIFYVKYEDFVKEPGKVISDIFSFLSVEQIDVLGKNSEEHGPVANGDIWNQAIVDSEFTRKKHLITTRERLVIFVFCFPLLIWYKYWN